MNMYLLFVIGIGLFFLGLYLNHVNNAMKQVPKDALRLSPQRWTDEEIHQTYRRVCENPVDFGPHLPSPQARRYVIVGGSGLVGGFLVLHLLARGQSPQSIRIIDFRRPVRKDLTDGRASDVQFVQADVTSLSSIMAAFQHPWAPDVASLPLTVFHTAASIRPAERAKIFYNRCSAVNVTGTENVLAAAHTAGADIFIATSSASVSLRPVNFWIPPWRPSIEGFVQIYRDPDQDKNIRAHGEYFSNYSMTKAIAEDAVLRAHRSSFRTGCIRPACGVYGNKYDIGFGSFMAKGELPTWIPHMFQNMVSAENISLAHLLYEKALLENSSTSGGKTFVITDPNPSVTFSDQYKLLNLLTGCRIIYLPPVLMLALAYCVELYCLALATSPLLCKFFSEPSGDIQMLQPAVILSSTVHQFAFDTPAQQSVDAGGLGYKGVCTTLEGMCNQVRQFNEEMGRV